MNTSGEGRRVDSAESQHWRTKLFDSYIAQGYAVHAIVGRPPQRPTERVPQPGQQYDYYTIPLPMSTEDEAHAQAFDDMMHTLRETHGLYNVVTAFPTDSMLQTDPELGVDTHLVIMVREPVALSA